MSDFGNGLPSQVPATVGNQDGWITPGDRGGSVLPDLSGGKILYGSPSAPTSTGILSLGDSITLGVTGGGATTPPAQTASVLSRNGATITAINQGQSGATSNDWIPGASSGYLANAKIAGPPGTCPVVHIMLGSNDSNAINRISAATFGANLLAIAKDLLSSGYRMVFLSYPPYSQPGVFANMDAAANVLQVGYQRAIDALVNGQTIRQGDTSAWLYFLGNQGELADGLHPSATGKLSLGTLWAAALGPAINLLVGPQLYAGISIGSGLTVSAGALTATGGGGGGVGELVVQDGTSFPPVLITTEDGTDYIYS